MNFVNSFFNKLNIIQILLKYNYSNQKLDITFLFEILIKSFGFSLKKSI